MTFQVADLVKDGVMTAYNPNNGKLYESIDALKDAFGDSSYEDFSLSPKHKLAKAIYHSNDLRYHNWRHIRDMILNIPKEFNGNHSGFHQFIDAIIWHDVVYVPGAKDNERKSYELFETLNHKDPLVESLIMTTSQHTVTGHHGKYHVWHELISDLDLYNLGGSWSEYLLNGSKIRNEFSLFDDEQFMEGRRKFLESYLNRKVFHTPFFSHREESAKNNMEKELYIITHLGELPSYEG